MCTSRLATSIGSLAEHCASLRNEPYISVVVQKGHKDPVMRSSSSVVIAIAATVTISIIAAPTAFARGGGGNGGGAHGGGAAMGQGSNPPGFSQGLKTGWHGSSVPPGWSKGKKTGWKDRGVPPGLYGR